MDGFQCFCTREQMERKRKSKCAVAEMDHLLKVYSVIINLKRIITKHIVEARKHDYLKYAVYNLRLIRLDASHAKEQQTIQQPYCGKGSLSTKLQDVSCSETVLLYLWILVHFI